MSEAVRGYGFWTKDGFFLKRCYDCGKENWASAVATGRCCFCGSTRHPLEEGKTFSHDGKTWTILEVRHQPISYVAEHKGEERAFTEEEVHGRPDSRGDKGEP